MELRIADLRRDSYMPASVRDFGDALMRRHPQCAAPLMRRWIGEAQRYVEV